jgi:hypothetical protein
MRRLGEWWTERRRTCPAVFVWPTMDAGPWAGPPGRLIFSCRRPLGHDGMHEVSWLDDDDGSYAVSWRDEARL